MQPRFRRAYGLAATLLAGALTFAVSYLFSLRGVDPQHQGFLFKSAVDVSRGLALYGETFTQYGALAVYLLVPGVLLFGETVVAINVMTCFAYALCAMLLSRIVLRYTNTVLALLCPMLAIGMAAFYFWNFHPWPSVFALMFSLAATLAMLRFVESRRAGWLVACGAATAAMFWCRQPQGLTALCGVLLLVGYYGVGYFDDRRDFWRAMGCFLLGNVLVHAALLLVPVLQGALHDWWIQTIRNAFAFAAVPTEETAASRPDGLLRIVFFGLATNPRYDFVWRVLTYGTLAYFLALCGACVVRARRTCKHAPDPATLGCIAFAAFALFNWPHYFPTLCYRHVFWSDYPMFGVLGVALYQLLQRLIPHKNAASASPDSAVCGQTASLASESAMCGQAAPVASDTTVFGQTASLASDSTLCGQAAPVATESAVHVPAAKTAAMMRHARVVTAVTCAILLLLCMDNLLLRARIGKSRLTGGGNGASFTTIEQAEEDTVLRYHNARYGYLNGLYLSARETRFYDGLFNTLARLQNRYPGKNIVNLTPNALFSVFTSENPHLRPYDDDPRDFGYPEQMDVTMAYIAQNRPIVLAHAPLPGYTVAAYLTDFNGDYWRFQPFYVLEPEA